MLGRCPEGPEFKSQLDPNFSVACLYSFNYMYTRSPRPECNCQQTFALCQMLGCVYTYSYSFILEKICRDTSSSRNTVQGCFMIFEKDLILMILTIWYGCLFSTFICMSKYQLCTADANVRVHLLLCVNMFNYECSIRLSAHWSISVSVCECAIFRQFLKHEYLKHDTNTHSKECWARQYNFKKHNAAQVA